jgi:hypothetical protein
MRSEQLRAVQFSWEELKRANDNLNEQITRKDQYAGKLKHLLEKGLAQRLEQSDQMMSVKNNVHMMSLPPPPCLFTRSNVFLRRIEARRRAQGARGRRIPLCKHYPDCPYNALRQVIQLLKRCADTSMNSVDGDGAR